ncbi:VCBS domain-containing protein [Shimia sp. Alg240-R146]|uniref:VCBS domain-containing protein n=1 Tax=Shimia sp. Alg240-R146 TaxID=2993449 RepID=UPI0022E06E90|nr:VCBS domain-containing protein [Shimia sp. Alg240-R146]
MSDIPGTDDPKVKKPALREGLSEEGFGWVTTESSDTTPEATNVAQGGEDASVTAGTTDGRSFILPMSAIAGLVGQNAESLPSGETAGSVSVPAAMPSLQGILHAFPGAVHLPNVGGHGGSIQMPLSSLGASVGISAPLTSGGGQAPSANPLPHLAVAGHPNGPAVAAMTATGFEEHPLSLLLAATDGNNNGANVETHLSGLPPGATLSAGHPEATGGWVIPVGTSLVGLTMTPAPNWFGQGSLAITVTQPDGQSTSTHLPFTVLNTPDAAQISGPLTGATTEDLVLSTSGQLTVVDPDPGEASFVAATQQGAYGRFEIDTAGAWHFALDNSNPDVQKLTTTDSVSETFQIQTVDGTTRPVTITVNGRDDGATISGTSVGAVTEDKLQSTGGQLSITDPDAGEAAFTPVSGSAGAAQYGSFALSADGHWSYTADNSLPAIQGLGAGQSLTDTLQITSVDGTTKQITVTISGTNDAPVLSAATASATEDGQSVTGQMSATDVDTGDTLTFGLPQAAPAGFALNADGSWSFDPTDAAYQHLAAGQTQQVTIPVMVSDGHGSDARNLVITVTGTNDRAVVTGPLTGTAVEDRAPLATGQLSVTDVDSGQSSFAAASHVGTYGTLAVDAQGAWTYTLNNASPAVQQLGEGDTRTESFVVQTTDGTRTTLLMNVQGTNDVPKLSASTATATEDGAQVSGTLPGTDADQHALLTFAVDGTAPAGFALHSDGSWTFDPTDAAYQSLAAGATQVVQVPVTVTDAQGASAQSTVTITVTGTDDQPVVAGAVALPGGHEDQTQVVTATQLLGQTTDIDSGDHLSIAGTPTADHGTFTANTDGSFTFHPEANYNGAVAISYQVTDGTDPSLTATATLTLAAVGDPAVITGGAASLTEDRGVSGGNLLTSGQLSITDPDAGEAAFTPVSGSAGAAQYGSFALSADGHWSYTADNSLPAIQGLGAGQSLTDTLQITSVDGTTKQITVTISGTNDAPVLSAATASATEDGQSVTGQMSATDVDTGDTLTFGLPQAAPAGFALNADGSWSFDPTDAAYQHLAAGQTQQVTIPVMVSDGHGSDARNLVITVTGTNDRAVVTGPLTGTAVEDRAPLATGQLSVTDVDSGQSSFAAASHVGTYGTLAVDAQGAWTYTLNNASPAVQQLGEGDTRTESFVVQTTDGTRTTLLMNVQGTNDVPKLSASTATATEDGAQVSGTLPGTDADQHALLTFAVDGTAPAGFALHSDGSWTFDPTDAAYQSLAAGATQVVQVPVTVTDAQGASAQSTVTITVTGTDDQPVVAGAVALPGGHEDQTQVVTATQLLGQTTDIDSGDHLSIAGTPTADHGTFTANTDGSFTFHPEANYNGAVAISYQVTDGTDPSLTATATLTLAAVGDPAVITDAQIPSITEDRSYINTHDELQVYGKLDIVDPDQGEAQFDINRGTQTTQGIGYDTHMGGHVLLSQDGSFIYYLDNRLPAVQELGAGESTKDTVTIRSVDGTTHQIQITIHGTNDAPVLSAATASAAEDGQSVTGQMSATDVDTRDTLGFAPANPVPGFTLNTDGSWSFDPTDAAYQHLAAGATQVVTIPVTVTDKTGATDTQNLVITVTGTNDGPSVSGPVTLPAGTEDTSVLISAAQLLEHATDIDTGDTLSVTGLSASHGTLSGDAVNGFTFTPDPNYNGPVNLSYTVTDSHGGTAAQTAALTLAATGDAAVIGGADTGSVTEGTAGQDMSPDYAQPGMAHLRMATLKVDGQLTIIDPDAGEAEFDGKGIGFNYQGQFGDLLLNPDGSWHYNADAGGLRFVGGRPTTRGTAIDQLGDGETLTDTITVHSKDGTPHDIVITIHGSNDRPYCSSEVVLRPGAEDTRQTLTSAQLLGNTVDVDANDAGKLAIANLHPDHGSILDNKDGTYTFTPEKDYNGTVHFTYDVKDAHGGVTHTGATTSLAAVGDQAVITGVGASLKEDVGVGTGVGDHGLLSAYGQFHVTDPDGASESQFPNMGFQTYTGSLGGSLQVNPDGQYIYHLANTIVDHLKTGEEAKDSFVIHSVDGTTHPVDFTIAGTNDAPVVYRNLVTKFEGENVFNGNIAAGDLDHDDSTSLTFTSNAPIAGFHLNNDGSYSFDPSNAAYSHLNNGDHTIISIPITVTDSDGLNSTGSLRVQLLGRNDAPVLSSATASATEDGNAVTGQMSATDVDGSSFTLQYSLGQTAPAGFSLSVNGSWSFDPTDAAYQHLAAGATQQVTVPVTVTDSAGATDTENLVITVTGTNDGPAVSGPVALPGGTEDKAVQITATQLLGHATDIDTGDQLSVTGLSASHGTLSGDAANGFTFTPDPNYNGPVSLSYTVTDNHGGTVAQTAALTLAAVGDAAVIGGVDTGSVTEGTAGQDMSPDYAQPGMAHLRMATLKVDGQLTIIDPDAGEAEFDGKGIGFNYQGQFGDLLLNPDGSWHYNADAGGLRFVGGRPTTRGTAIDQLGDGETLTDTITVHSKDGTPHDIVITIHGSNDRPYCSSEVVLRPGAEDTRQTLTSAQLLGNTVDVDANDAGKLAIANLHPDHGSILDNKDGTYTFTPEKDYNGTVHFTYDVKDAHGGVTHTGATTSLAAVGDQAVITGVGASLKEDVGVGTGVGDHGLLSAYGQFHVTDPDGASESQFPNMGFQTYTGSLGGSLQVNPDGQYIYHLANTIVDHLKTGEEAKDSFVIHSVDGTTHPVDFTIAGTNDAPVVYRNLVTKFEGENVFNGNIAAGDLDHDDSTSLTFTSNAPIAGFHLNNDGSYSFDPSNAAYSHLNNGDHTIISIPITVTDSDGLNSTGSLRVQLLGRNDAPVLSSATASATEDGNAVTGQMSATDVDGSSFTLQYSLGQTAPAGFSLSVNGSWSFDPTDAAYQHLAAGATQQVTVPVTVTDSAGATDTENLVITVTGTNDGPAVSGPVALPGGTEDKAVQITATQLLGHATDIDTGDQLSVTGLSASHGTLSGDAANGFTFTPDPNYNGPVQLNYTVTDGQGGTAAQTATLTLSATNDAAVISGTDKGSVTEDGQLTVSGTLTIADVDAGEAALVAQASQQGANGTFSVAADGSWTYTLNNTLAATQALRSGETVMDRIWVQSLDGSAHHAIEVTVHGTNDAPVLTAATASATEDGQAVTGRMSATDADVGDNRTFAIGAAVDGFSIDRNGNWTFDPTNAAYQTLAAGATQKVAIPVTVTDSEGATDTQDLVITVAGSNDGPIVSGSVAMPVMTEDRTVTLHADAILQSLNVQDIDGDTITVSDIHVANSVGQIVNNHDGTFSFTPAPDYHHDNVAVTVTVSDGHTTTDAHGTFDIAPVTDLATPGLTISAQQQVMHFDSSSAAAIFTRETVQNGGPISALAVEMTVLGGQQVASAGIHGATLASYETGTHTDEMYIYKPDSLTIKLDGHEYDTRVALLSDGHDHRYSFLWNGQAGTLDVLIDGNCVKHMDNVAKGSTLTDGGTLAFGGDQDSLRGGFSGNDAFNGKIFSAALATSVVDVPDLQHTSLANQLHGDPSLLTAVQIAGGQILDQTGNFHYDTHGTFTHPTVVVDTSIAPPNPGATLVLATTLGAPRDPDDHIVAAELTGLPDGTVISDGVGGHSFTVSQASPGIDIKDWTLASLTATPPASFHGNVRIVLAVTTEGPDGTQAVAETSKPLIFDPSLPVADATISGDDNKTTDEDTAVSGILTVTDATPSDAHIVGTTLNGTYGRLVIGANGHWTYSPDDRADALLAGSLEHETFTVHSVDGTTHDIEISLQGREDRAVVTGVSRGGITEDQGPHTVVAQISASGDLAITDPDAGEAGFVPQTSVAGANGYGTFDVDASGHWSYSADNQQAAIQTMGPGQQLTDKLTVMTVDGTSQEITVTINGAIDDPTVHAVTQVAASVPGHALVEVVTTGRVSNLQTNGFTLHALGYGEAYETGGKLVDLAATSGTVGVSDGGIGVDSPTPVGATVQTTPGANQINSQLTDITRPDDQVGQTLVVELQGLSRSAFLSLDSMGGQGDRVSWVAYGADHSVVAKGILEETSATNPTNIKDLSIETTVPFAFIALHAEAPPRTNAHTHFNTNVKLTHVEAELVRYATNLDLSGQTGDSADQDQSLTWHVEGLHNAALSAGSHNQDGSWTVTAAQLQGLQVLHSTPLDLVVTAISTDAGTGQTATSAPVHVAVDPAGAHYTVITGVPRVRTDEDAHRISGDLDIDTNLGTAPTFFDGDQQGQYGLFHVDQDGQWTYTVDNAKANSMATGETQAEHFTVQTTNGATKEMLVLVSGSDDLGHLTEGATQGTARAQASVVGGQLAAHDVDTDAGRYMFVLRTDHGAPATSIDGQFGSVAVDLSSGVWTYSIDPAKAAAIHPHQTVMEEFTVYGTVGGISSATTPVTLRVSVDGQGNAQVQDAIFGTSTGQVTEDTNVNSNNHLAVNGSMALVDPDTEQWATHWVHGTYGDLIMNKDGNWMYAADNGNPAIQALDTGDQLTDTLLIQSSTHQLYEVTIAIHGTDEGPTMPPPPPPPAPVGPKVMSDEAQTTTDMEAQADNVDMGEAAAATDAVSGIDLTGTASTSSVGAYLDAVGVSQDADSSTLDATTPENPYLDAVGADASETPETGATGVDPDLLDIPDLEDGTNNPDDLPLPDPLDDVLDLPDPPPDTDDTQNG